MCLMVTRRQSTETVLRVGALSLPIGVPAKLEVIRWKFASRPTTPGKSARNTIYGTGRCKRQPESWLGFRLDTAEPHDALTRGLPRGPLSAPLCVAF